MDADAIRRRLADVLKALEQAYGRREPESRGSGVDVLVATLLSQNTSRANSRAGYRQLRRRFGSWTQVADAPVRQIAECIRISGLSNVKAPRIRDILRRLRADRGRISLEFLRKRPVEEAKAYLLGLHGVGAKTASCVLLFAFNAPVFPVDTHVRRTAARLGLVEAKATPEQVEEELTELIPPEDRYAMHVLLIEHGRRTCRARGPRCAWCDLADGCPEGRRRLSRRAE